MLGLQEFAVHEVNQPKRDRASHGARAVPLEAWSLN